MNQEELCGNTLRHWSRVAEPRADYGGGELLDRIGEEVVREAVISVLSGGNVRSLTENLTRQRLTLANAALFVSFLRSHSEISEAKGKFLQVVRAGLKTAKTPEQKQFLQWCVGLTQKGIQNILRSDNTLALDEYLQNLEDSLAQAARQCGISHGEVRGVLELDGKNHAIDWPFLLHLFVAIGSQTLTIRGSEKSKYGKLFEKLILGSALTLLGFTRVDKDDTTATSNAFWLSSRGEKRESDATLLYRPGVGVKFDIGFIGPGNTEISLDKVSRFEKQIEHGEEQYSMSTIVLVDRIGKGSRIDEAARNIGGTIVQMSMTHWLREVALVLEEKIAFKHPICSMSSERSLQFIRDEMRRVDLRAIIG